MPRPFSPSEKDFFRTRLLEVGHTHFSRFGLKKTNVGELCDAVGIAKGSFYLFFETKELLFAEVLAEVEGSLRTELLQALDARRPDARAMLTFLLRSPARLLAHHPILRILAEPDELQLLMARLPPEVMHHNQEDDEVFYGRILRSWQAEGLMKPHDPALVVGVLRAVFALSLQRPLVGDAVFDPVLDLLIDGIVLQLLPEFQS